MVMRLVMISMVMMLMMIDDDADGGDDDCTHDDDVPATSIQTLPRPQHVNFESLLGVSGGLVSR